LIRSPREIIEEIEQTQETISIKEMEVSSLNSKLTRLNLELADATNPNKFCGNA
jgi:hypothetical protein